MKMKCPICKRKRSTGVKYSDYCEKCGLFLGEINKEGVVEKINSMVEKWNTHKKFNFYTKWSDGHIRFEYRGIKKIIDYITFGDDLTIEQYTALIQVISYLTVEFDFNITGLAVTLFAFSSQYIESAIKPFKYWIKVGIKEKNRTAYEYYLSSMYSAGLNKTKRGKKKILRIKEYLRSLPNYQI